MKFVDITMLELVEKVKAGQKLSCFGAGRVLQQFSHVLRSLGCIDAIDCVVDNNSALHGKQINLRGLGQTVTVFPPNYLLKYPSSNVIVITNRLAKDEIKKQLAGMTSLGDVAVCSYGKMFDEYAVERARSIQLPTKLRVTDKPVIPKVIHYCWFGRNKIPQQYKEWMASWKKFCPDYEIVEWNEDNYDVNKIEYISEAYKAGKWSFVTDYARMDIICEYGGIYLDTDVELVRSIEDLRYVDGFFGFQEDGRVASGLGFGAFAGLPIIAEMRDVYVGEHFTDFSTVSARYAKQIKACPDYETAILENHGLIRDAFFFQRVAGLNIYPAPVLCGEIKGNLIDNKNIFSIHHYAASWMPGT